jgi:hypothetical protein
VPSLAAPSTGVIGKNSGFESVVLLIRE